MAFSDRTLTGPRQLTYCLYIMWNISHYKGKGNGILQGERYEWISKPFLLFSIKGKVLCNWFPLLFPFPLQCECFRIIYVPFPVPLEEAATHSICIVHFLFSKGLICVLIFFKFPLPPHPLFFVDHVMEYMTASEIG